MSMSQFSALSRSQQKMRVGGLRGELCVLTLRRSSAPLQVEALHLASLGGPDTGAFEGHLVCRSYFSGDLWVFALSDIAQIEPKERPITDPQHPDWQDPGRSVRAAKKVTRR